MIGCTRHGLFQALEILCNFRANPPFQAFKHFITDNDELRYRACLDSEGGKRLRGFFIRSQGFTSSVLLALGLPELPSAWV